MVKAGREEEDEDDEEDEGVLRDIVVLSVEVARNVVP